MTKEDMARLGRLGGALIDEYFECTLIDITIPFYSHC